MAPLLSPPVELTAPVPAELPPPKRHAGITDHRGPAAVVPRVRWGGQGVFHPNRALCRAGWQPPGTTALQPAAGGARSTDQRPALHPPLRLYRVPSDVQCGRRDARLLMADRLRGRTG